MRRRTALALALAAVLAGCASAPPQRLSTIQPLVGKWQGTISVGRGSPEFYFLTVNPDGTIVATWGANWQWGTLTADGSAGVRFTLDHITSGTLLYYSGPDGRAIQMTPDFGGWFVWARPVS